MSAVDVRGPRGGSWPDSARTRAASTPITLVLLAVPVIVGLSLAWANRWIADDGFINVRVVENVLAGHGPVYNVGERVEVGTSPAWTAVLVIGAVIMPWMEVGHVAIVLGLVSTGAALVLAQIAAVRGQQVGGEAEGVLDGLRRTLPFGVVLFVALPPAADFATSGLEGSLGLVWLAAGQWCLATVGLRPTRWAVVVAAGVIGLGPLVRPDFAVVTVVLGAAAFGLARPLTRRRVVAMALAGGALPVGYQLFRMAYYAELLPHSAMAKEAGTANWTQGLHYLDDFAAPYLLTIPAVLVGVALAVVAGRAPRRGRVVLLAPVVGGLVHGLFVVRGGGDFMHGRMLLPAAFLVVLPVAVLVRDRVLVALVVGALLWTAVPIRVGGPRYRNPLSPPHGITDEHRAYTGGHRHPATAADVAGALLFSGSDGTLTVVEDLDQVAVPLDPGVPYVRVVARGSIGALGMVADDDHYVLDLHGLASPLGARFVLQERGRPGHEKAMPMAWALALHADPAAALPAEVDPAEVAAARRALRCPEIADIVERPRLPLTLGTALRNMWSAITDHGVRVDPDPREAQRGCRP